MEKFKELRGIGPALKALKMSGKTAAVRSGVDPTLVSRYATGDRALPLHHAEALAPVLKSEPSTLQFDNRRRMFERAADSGDSQGVMMAVQSAMKITERDDLSDAGEAALDELLTAAENFIDKLANKSRAPQDDEERYDAPGADGRDAKGRFVGVEKATADWAESASAFNSIWGPDPVSSRNPEEDEEFDPPGIDGRDLNGHRVLPFDDLDEEDDFEEDEEELYG